MADDLRELVERAREGDSAAFEVLYQRFERSTYGLCCHLLGDPEAAMDAVQETFVTVYENLHRLRHPAAFATWLRGAAVNACRWLRRKGRWVRPWSEAGERESLAEEAPSGAPGPPAQILAGELGLKVREALARLSPPHREVVVLHHLQGLPLDEIAATLGVAEGTVKSRLGRARAHLERLLTPYLGEES